MQHAAKCGGPDEAGDNQGEPACIDRGCGGAGVVRGFDAGGVAGGIFAPEKIGALPDHQQGHEPGGHRMQQDHGQCGDAQNDGLGGDPAAAGCVIAIGPAVDGPLFRGAGGPLYGGVDIPVAVVIVGGLFSSTLLDLIVTPTAFYLFGRKASEQYIRFQANKGELL